MITPGTIDRIESWARRVASIVLRYGLVIVIAWIGALKFTDSEAIRIQRYVSHSPFMSWTNDIAGLRLLSGTFGVIEITAAVLIALRPVLPRLSAFGSLMGSLLFLTTLSFFFTTPGVGDPQAGGFPALSPVGQFLVKDVVLLGTAIWTGSDALRAARVRRGAPRSAVAEDQLLPS